jgi:hypothetical protein
MSYQEYLKDENSGTWPNNASVEHSLEQGNGEKRRKNIWGLYVDEKSRGKTVKFAKDEALSEEVEKNAKEKIECMKEEHTKDHKDADKEDVNEDGFVKAKCVGGKPNADDTPELYEK